MDAQQGDLETTTYNNNASNGQVKLISIKNGTTNASPVLQDIEPIQLAKDWKIGRPKIDKTGHIVGVKTNVIKLPQLAVGNKLNLNENNSNNRYIYTFSHKQIDSHLESEAQIGLRTNTNNNSWANKLGFNKTYYLSQVDIDEWGHYIK
ncbi:MAG: hypothetical protein J6W64_05755 [Bacilli bacterium]|nr:hypothetical protein [Bacilli bacterium]